MKILIRLFDANRVPEPIAERIIATVKAEVECRKKFAKVIKEIQNLCVRVNLSQRHMGWRMRSSRFPLCTKTDCFFGDTTGKLEYYTRNVYDVTKYSAPKRSAIYTRVMESNCDYGWELQIVRLKLSHEDYPNLLMIETWEDISPDALVVGAMDKASLHSLHSLSSDIDD